MICCGESRPDASRLRGLSSEALEHELIGKYHSEHHLKMRLINRIHDFVRVSSATGSRRVQGRGDVRSAVNLGWPRDFQIAHLALPYFVPPQSVP